MNTKLIYKLLKSNDHKIKVTVPTMRRIKYVRYVKVISK